MVSEGEHIPPNHTCVLNTFMLLEPPPAGAHVHPDDHGGDVDTRQLCLNMPMQRGQHKRIVLSRSDVSGWGAFLPEGAAVGDFISEYRGEYISQVRGASMCLWFHV